MRWPIPIAVVLALLVAVSCDQQPVEPVDESLGGETVSFGKNPATVSVTPWSGTFDLCGEEVYAEVAWRTTTREAINADSPSHFFQNITNHGWAVSTTSGDRWRMKETWNWQNQWFDSSTDTGSYRWHVRWIGLGQAPNYEGYFFAHWTVNANGEVVVDWEEGEFFVIQCPA